MRWLFIDPARRLPGRRFLLAGAQYPHDFPWTPNIWFVRHLPPGEHAAFFSSSRLTLNVTRAEMVRRGFSPSVRLFEAGLCGTPTISDDWPGLGAFFRPGEEILVARSGDDVLGWLRNTPESQRRAIGARARARVLAAHTGAHRAAELERHVHRALDARALARQAAPA